MTLPQNPDEENEVMTLSMLFWVLMLFWLIFGIWWGFRPNGDRWFAGGSLLLFLLLLVVGMAVFGSPIQGK